MFSEEALKEIAAHWKIPPDKFEKGLDSAAAIAATECYLAEASRLLAAAGSYPCLFVGRGDGVYAIT